MPPSPSTSRLEAFSDGVIAVIITIMVLELKIPHENGFDGIRSILPTLLVYLLSFTFTAIYWINHHHLVHRIEHVNPGILYANLLFLFCLSLLPFFTLWVIEKDLDSFSVALYAVSLMITGVGFLVLRFAIDRRLRENGSFDHVNAGEQRKHLISLGLYALAIPLAYVHARLALSGIALITLVWIIPTDPLTAKLAARSKAETSSSNSKSEHLG